MTAWQETAIPLTAEETINRVLPRHRRIMVTGCNGLLGQKLCQLLLPFNAIIGVDLTDRSVCTGENFQHIVLDISHRDEVLKAVLETKPGFIINTAAITDVDGCEVDRDLCWRVNVLGVENLIRAARKTNASLVQVSSDYVFDGHHAPYRETDNTAPLGFYGKSKLAGENAVRSAGIHYAIVRTQVLYGVAQDVRPSFVHWVLQKLQEDGEFKVVDDQRGNPTLADDLAEGIARLIQLDKQGIYHLSGSESVSRRQFAQAVALEFCADPARVKPLKTADLNQKSPRPEDSTFILEKIERELAFTPRNIAAGLREFHRQWNRLQGPPGR
jgi:dTDP-4-dehydrorhamnose reductase